MKLLTVIPFSKSPGLDTLSYFSAEDVAVGSIVQIPLRKKQVRAFVIESEDLSMHKSGLKKADYKLKKITKVLGSLNLEPAYLKSIDRIAEFYSIRQAAAFTSLFPTQFLPLFEKTKSVSKPAHRATLHEQFLFQKKFDDRIVYYRTYIREAFAKRESVHIIVPYVRSIETYASLLSKGIEKYVYTFSSQEIPKKLKEKYAALATEEHPVLMITTAPYLAIPKDDRMTVILDQESSRGYRTIGRSHIDLRTFVETYASYAKIKYIVGGTYLRFETLHQEKLGTYLPLERISWKIGLDSAIKIHERRSNMEKSKDAIELSKKTKWQIFEDETLDAIKKVLDKGGHVFIHTLRNGLAPVTVCNDCGHSVNCPTCDKPLALYMGRTVHERMFICNRCNTETGAMITCSYCKSWNLKSIGIAADAIREILKKQFPKTPCLEFDTKVAQIAREDFFKKFYETPGAILLGTEQVIPFLTNETTLSVITSFDALFAIPSYSIGKQIIDMTTELYERTAHPIIIQTALANQPILKSIASDRVFEIYEKEIEERKKFNYPPFARIIKISFAGSVRAIENTSKRLEELLADYKPVFFNGYIERVKNVFVSHCLIRLPANKWSIPTEAGAPFANQELLSLLRRLPPHIVIEIDPENIFS